VSELFYDRIVVELVPIIALGLFFVSWRIVSIYNK
jgi:hypothetical protein